MLKSINLSISCVCGANCIFCPRDRGVDIKEKIMPFISVKKIIEEIASKDFKRHHNIKRIIIGENGDAFLNKDIIDILRYIRLNTTTVKIVLYTNFQYFTKKKVEVILKERLVDLIRCNVDGSTPQNYYNVKQIDYNTVKNNILNFIFLRKYFGEKIPIYLSILTLNRYVNTIYKNFGFYPMKISDPGLINREDDATLIKKEYSKIFDKKIDKIFITRMVMAWAEREISNENIDYKKYSCPNIIRIQHEAFIAPDGTWYACCLDSNRHLALGNINKNSLNEIYFSKTRDVLINLLQSKQNKKIGGPCSTIDCCYYMHKNRFISKFFRMICKNRLLVKIWYEYFYLRLI